MNSNVTAAWRAHKRGALLRQSLLHADSPDVHSGERRPPVEADADEREPAQRRPRVGAQAEGRQAAARTDSGERARLLPRTQVPELRQPRAARRRVPQRQAGVRRRPRRRRQRAGRLPRLHRRRSKRLGVDTIREKYGNLFQMYQKITDEDPYKVPMRIYPAIHYTMGGLWVDYNLMSNDSRAARARRSQLLGPRRQPARGERPDAGPGGRLLRHSVHHRRLPGEQRRCRRSRPITTRSRKPSDNVAEADRQAAGRQGQRAASGEIHRELGRIMWDDVGMARTEASLQRALDEDPEAARGVLAERLGARHADNLNQSLEYAGRVADYLEFAELLALDALQRTRIVRRPFPRGKPDAGRRSAPRRRELHVRRGLGIQGRRAARRSCTRSRSSSTKCIRRSGATSRARVEASVERSDLTIASRTHETQPEDLASGRADGRGTAGRLRRPTTSRPTCRSSRCSTSSTKG